MARTNAEIADELEAFASFLDGSRLLSLATIVAELRGENPPEPTPQQVRDAEVAAQQQAAVKGGSNPDPLATDPNAGAPLPK